MEEKRMQIVYGIDVRKIGKLGANWMNIVQDIHTYLTEQGFEYSRTLGYVNDRVLPKEKLAEIAGEIIAIGIEEKNFLYIEMRVISDTIVLFENGKRVMD